MGGSVGRRVEFLCVRRGAATKRRVGTSTDRRLALGPVEGRSVAASISAFIRRTIIDREAHRAETHCKLMAVGLLLLAACCTAEVEPGPITSFEDIAGTIYKRGPGHSPLYFQFFEDGTFHLSTSQLLVEDALGGAHIYETRFEGTTLFVKGLKESEYSCDDDPIYEIHLLENGNLQLVAIEDPCVHRLEDWQAEWEPVP